jgi:succinate dehydrogenase / fumarate reductase, membrane anchor subunit
MAHRFEDKGSIRTPLAKAKGLGASGGGTDHFWHHRISAVSNALLVLPFIVIVASIAGRPYPEVIGIMSQPLVGILLALFVVSITYHMRLGMQIVIEDYVHDKGLKFAAVIANTFFAILVAASCLYAILRISFSPLF